MYVHWSRFDRLLLTLCAEGGLMRSCLAYFSEWMLRRAEQQKKIYICVVVRGLPGVTRGHQGSSCQSGWHETSYCGNAGLHSTRPPANVLTLHSVRMFVCVCFPYRCCAHARRFFSRTASHGPCLLRTSRRGRDASFSLRRQEGGNHERQREGGGGGAEVGGQVGRGLRLLFRLRWCWWMAPKGETANGSHERQKDQRLIFSSYNHGKQKKQRNFTRLSLVPMALTRRLAAFQSHFQVWCNVLSLWKALCFSAGSNVVYTVLRWDIKTWRERMQNLNKNWKKEMKKGVTITADGTLQFSLKQELILQRIFIYI